MCSEMTGKHPWVHSNHIMNLLNLNLNKKRSLWVCLELQLTTNLKLFHLVFVNMARFFHPTCQEFSYHQGIRWICHMWRETRRHQEPGLEKQGWHCLTSMACGFSCFFHVFLHVFPHSLPGSTISSWAFCARFSKTWKKQIIATPPSRQKPWAMARWEGLLHIPSFGKTSLVAAQAAFSAGVQEDFNIIYILFNTIAWFCICFQNTIFHSLSICPWSQTYFACPKGLTFLNDALLINNLLRWSHMTSILKKHFPCWVSEGVVGLQIYVAMAHLRPHDKWRRFQFNWWINYKCVRISRIQTPY